MDMFAASVRSPGEPKITLEFVSSQAMQDEALGESNVYCGRRRHQRRLAFPLGLSATAKIFVDDAFIRNCTLQDLSNGGACLLVHQPYDIPELFDLVLDAFKHKENLSRTKVQSKARPAAMS
jgi:hypothetical protein